MITSSNIDASPLTYILHTCMSFEAAYIVILIEKKQLFLSHPPKTLTLSSPDFLARCIKMKLGKLVKCYKLYLLMGVLVGLIGCDVIMTSHHMVIRYNFFTYS